MFPPLMLETSFPLIKQLTVIFSMNFFLFCFQVISYHPRCLPSFTSSFLHPFHSALNKLQSDMGRLAMTSSHSVLLFSFSSSWFISLFFPLAFLALYIVILHCRFEGGDCLLCVLSGAHQKHFSLHLIWALVSSYRALLSLLW